MTFAKFAAEVVAEMEIFHLIFAGGPAFERPDPDSQRFFVATAPLLPILRPTAILSSRRCVG